MGLLVIFESGTLLLLVSRNIRPMWLSQSLELLQKCCSSRAGGKSCKQHLLLLNTSNNIWLNLKAETFGQSFYFWILASFLCSGRKLCIYCLPNVVGPFFEYKSCLRNLVCLLKAMKSQFLRHFRCSEFNTPFNLIAFEIHK